MSFTHRSGWNLKRVCFSTCLVVALAGCCSAIAAGDGTHGVTLDVKDARLGDVVSLLTLQSGANIFINPDVENKKVTAHAVDMPLEKALESVVKHAAGVDFWKDEDGSYFIGSKKPSEASATVTDPPVFVPSAEPVEQPIEQKAQLKTETIKLQNLSPEQILVALNVIEPPTDFFGGKLKPVVAIWDQDNGQLRPTSNKLGPIVLHDDTAPSLDPGSTLSSNGAGRSADRNDGPPQYGAPAYRPTPAASPTRMASPTQSGNNNQNNLLPDGVQMVMPFATDNSLIVRGTEEGIAQFKDVVHLLDIAPKQVMVKAEFIEVSTDEAKRFGIDWSINRLNQSFSTNFNPGGNVVYGLTAGNLTATLRAELTRGSGRVINSPIITTLNNEMGVIQIQRQIPYWTTQTLVPSSGVASTSYSLQFLQVNTELDVVPRVNGDGTITLQLAPQVSDPGTIVKGPDGVEVPQTSSQRIALRRRVMNGETIVCGGFIRKNDSTSESRIPILGNLPVIGSLFRSTVKSVQDSELLIFVTPTIIGESAAGSSVGVSP